MKSWMKQRHWNLDNGWVAVTETGFYGEMVVTFSIYGEIRWHCSRGLETIPKFARTWIDQETGVVKPVFEKVYPSLEEPNHESLP